MSLLEHSLLEVGLISRLRISECDFCLSLGSISARVLLANKIYVNCKHVKFSCVCVNLTFFEILEPPPGRMKRHLDRTESVNSLISKVTGIFNRGVTETPTPFEGATLMAYSACQEIFLPTEVLLEIFKCLRRLDVEKMKTV